MLRNNYDDLAKHLEGENISTIVCSRVMDGSSLGNLLRLAAVQRGIHLYPPLKAQTRTFFPASLSSANNDIVFGTMSYVVRITSLTNRTGKKSVKIFYQSYQTDNEQQEILYSATHFAKDELALSKDIINKMENMYEFKVNYTVKSQNYCFTGLVLKLSFKTFHSGTPKSYSDNDKWILDSVSTWPVCEFDLPQGEIIDLEHEFYGQVISNLGKSILEYLEYYANGLHPF